jgi:hypothetical protein
VFYLFKTKYANKKLKLDADAPNLCNSRMVLKKQGKNSMQTKELIGPGVAMGNSQDYGVIHYIDESLLDDYSFPVKKFTTKLFPISFRELLTLEDTKIICVLQRKL